MKKVYIDGREGTTGLQIEKRLQDRKDLELLTIEPELRKDPVRRKELMAQADLTFLCLPDQAAIEAVELLKDLDTRVIDASTAHRVNPDWVYGFPELGKRADIASARFLANPGCHATGFISIAAPLVKLGILPETYPVSAYSLTGYSGGGKKMIAQYEDPEKTGDLFAPRIYGLNMSHKHLPEMQKLSGLVYKPAFSPIVDDYYKGMATVLTLHNSLLNGKPDPEQICEKLQEFYAGEPVISVKMAEEKLLSANAMAGKDSLEILVSGNETQTILTARFDNLGKGASGAAVQNMNIMLGFPETRGLNL